MDLNRDLKCFSKKEFFFGSGPTRPITYLLKTSSSCLLLFQKRLDGDVNWKKATFRYPTRPQIRVLRDLDLSLKAGQNVALVGPSGCGKSTCVQLLQRFYDLKSGELVRKLEILKTTYIKYKYKRNFLIYFCFSVFRWPQYWRPQCAIHQKPIGHCISGTNFIWSDNCRKYHVWWQWTHCSYGWGYWGR